VKVHFEMISKYYTNEIGLSRLQFVANNQLNEKQLRYIVSDFSLIKVFQEAKP